jgi:nucleotide-binding universal stress UspA family protein
MLKSIMVALDGTAGSWAGVDLAVRWAAGSGATLVGLGVVDEPGIRAPEMAPIGGEAFKEHRDAAILARAARKVEEFLDEFRARCGAARVAGRVLEVTGDPYDRIVSEAQRFDLVVLGRETHFRFATQSGPDSVLQRVLRDAPRPVVSVPENPAGGAGVMVAYDGSLQAARALFAFRASGLDIGGPVHLVSVGDDPAEAGQHLSRAAEFLGSHAITATRHPVQPDGSVARTLVEAARALDAGLVVAGTYGRSTLREFFLGSVTRSLLSKSAVPLLLFH